MLLTENTVDDVKLMDTKERSLYGKEEAMDFCVIEWTLRVRWKNERWREDERREEGRWLKVKVMNCLLNSNSPSCTYCRSEAAGVLPIWQSPESIRTKPYWLIHPELLFVRSVRQVGTGGWKGIRPLCHVGPPGSLTSYGRATWVGNECTRLEKEKKKKMLVPQEEKGIREGGTWEGEGVTCKEESN